MNFSKKRPVKIVMLGAGGTGAHIAPHLYRLLYALERPVKFIICDGDKVEPKNLVRQNFTEADLGENKARVIAERYSDVFGLETSYIPRFIEDAGQLEELLRPEVFRHYVYGSEPNTGRWVTNSELVILIGAVDNNKSRKLCHEVFLRARDLVYIDSGNGEYTGQIVCGIRRAGKTVYKPVGMLYPEVSTPEDLFPTEVSCAEASVSAPQTIVANLMAASIGERGSELALLKAIGATDGAVSRLMLAETAVISLVGAIAGALLGSGVAQIVGHVVFGSGITMRPMVFVLVFVLLAVTVLVASLSSIRAILGLRPAEVLHGR